MTDEKCHAKRLMDRKISGKGARSEATKKSLTQRSKNKSEETHAQGAKN